MFCARGRGELLIVQHWRSSNKRGPHCCCHWWGIVVWESLSPAPSHREGMLDAGAPQEFALLTQGRNWTLLYQSQHFTAQTSQPWETWGSVYTAAYCPGSKANTLYGLGGVSMTEAHFSPAGWGLCATTQWGKQIPRNWMRYALRCRATIQFCDKLSRSVSRTLASEIQAYCVLKGRVSNGFYVKIIHSVYETWKICKKKKQDSSGTLSPAVPSWD